MDTKRVLSALCYFSILFAGILFPIVAYFAAADRDDKYHAKKALFSHLLPLIPLPLILIAAYFEVSTGHGDLPVLMFAGIILSIILSFIVLIWNLVKGIKVLNKDRV